MIRITGGICIAPRPSSPGAPIVPGMAMRAVPGMNPVLMDEKGREVPGERDIAGALCLKTPWPGMARTVYGSHKRFDTIRIWSIKHCFLMHFPFHSGTWRPTCQPTLAIISLEMAPGETKTAIGKSPVVSMTSSISLDTDWEQQR